MNEWAKAVVLGVVEGLTECVPVSSTGHVLLASALQRLEQSEHRTFEIFIQSGAVLRCSRSTVAPCSARRVRSPMTRPRAASGSARRSS